MAWDLLDEDCSDISDWSDAGTGTAVSEVDPAGQFRFDTNAGAAGNAYCFRYRALTSPPDKLVIEIKTYFDSLGLLASYDCSYLMYSTDSWAFQVWFASDGLFVTKTGAATGEVGTNIVKEGVSAAWQIWRFEIDKSGGEDAATVEVFLDNVSQGTVDCDWETAQADGRCSLLLYGYATDDIVCHFDYLKIRTGIPLYINVHDCTDLEDKVIGG